MFTNHAMVQIGLYLENWEMLFFLVIYISVHKYKNTSFYKACASLQLQVRNNWVQHWYLSCDGMYQISVIVFFLNRVSLYVSMYIHVNGEMYRAHWICKK